MEKNKNTDEEMLRLSEMRNVNSIMTHEKARAAFENDPVFHQLVEVMLNAIETLQLTPGELRCAANLASIIFEERNARPFPVRGFIPRPTGG